MAHPIKAMNNFFYLHQIASFQKWFIFATLFQSTWLDVRPWIAHIWLVVGHGQISSTMLWHVGFAVLNVMHKQNCLSELNKLVPHKRWAKSFFFSHSSIPAWQDHQNQQQQLTFTVHKADINANPCCPAVTQQYEDLVFLSEHSLIAK